MNTEEKLLIAIVTLVSVLLIFMVDMYRRIFAIYHYSKPESPPPRSLTMGSMFDDEEKDS